MALPIRTKHAISISGTGREVVGGIVVRVGEDVIDGSVASRFEQARRAGARIFVFEANQAAKAAAVA